MCAVQRVACCWLCGQPMAVRPVFLRGLYRQTAPKSKESETILEADGTGKRLEEKEKVNWRETADMGP